MGFSGSLEKMQITAYQRKNFTGEVGSFSVYINPEKYSHSFEICYNDDQAQGSSGGSPDFNRTPSDTVEFELVFDGTGVIPPPIPGVTIYTGDGITKQIEKFMTLVFTYNSKGRLESLSLTYTLFKPDGTPLRARARASFISFNDETELALKANKSSPDVSHLLTVGAGDTLPLMCYEVYGSSVYYPQVARANGLTDFRHIPAGTQLLFPPLGTSTL
jgi:nucleoid-associated protein YgaU